jgi:hypothetical protein
MFTLFNQVIAWFIAPRRLGAQPHLHYYHNPVIN